MYVYNKNFLNNGNFLFLVHILRISNIKHNIRYIFKSILNNR